MRQRFPWLIGAIRAAFLRRGTAWTATDLSRADIDAMLTLVETDHPAVVPDQDADPILHRLSRIFTLTDLDLDLLTVAAAAEADLRICALLGVLAGNPGLHHPSVGVALELSGRSLLDGEARSRLRSAGPLVRHALVEIDGAGPLPQRLLRVPDRVLAHLLGDDSPEAAMAAMVVEVPVVGSATATAIGRAMASGASLVHITQAVGTSGTSTAAGAFAAAGISALVVDLRRRGHRTDVVAAAGTAAREAGLLGRGLVVTGTADAAERMPELLDTLTGSPVPVVVVDSLRWRNEWTSMVPFTATAPALARDDRERLWLAGGESGTDTSGDEHPLASLPGWPDLLNLALTPEEITSAGQAATADARAQGREVTMSDLRHAARLHGGEQLAASAHRIVPQAGLDDLILPDETRRSLQELISWARHREELLGQAGLRGKGTKGSGILSLFAGPPGTGKTLAAEAVAGELGLELYVVDLSAVVDKYIGETEKKLENIIREAESLNVVLFFDEADAIFGSRSAVKDAKDRYANQEVSFLLQRMEQFDGLAVLATNLRGNLDAAFSRRLHFMITFLEPDARIRAELWRVHLQPVAETDPDDPIDLVRLSEALELPGGGIKNVVMAAAFSARASDEPVGMRHLLSAAERELGKLGRRVPPQLLR